jgi:hypothetical protein
MDGRVLLQCFGDPDRDVEHAGSFLLLGIFLWRLFFLGITLRLDGRGNVGRSERQIRTLNDYDLAHISIRQRQSWMRIGPRSLT